MIQGGGRHDPQAARQVDRRKFGAWLGRSGDGRHRDRAVLLGQRDRRLIGVGAGARPGRQQPDGGRLRQWGGL